MTIHDGAVGDARKRRTEDIPEAGELTREQRAELRAKAEAATPGPWEDKVLGSEGYAVMAENPSGSIRRLTIARCGHEEWDTDKSNAAYIAAASPDVVLALLDAADEAERVSYRIVSNLGQPDHATITREGILIFVGHAAPDCLAALTAARAEAAYLRRKLAEVEALADEMGSAFPYVQVAALRAVLASGESKGNGQGTADRDAIEELTEAIRFSVEYVGTDVLQPIKGWSWYDALCKYAPHKAAAFDPAPGVVSGGEGETIPSICFHEDTCSEDDCPCDDAPPGASEPEGPLPVWRDLWAWTERDRTRWWFRADVAGESR